MWLKYFILGFSLLSASAYADCFNRVVFQDAQSCREYRKVAGIRNCLNTIQYQINSCIQEMESRKNTLTKRKENILSLESKKVEEASAKMLASGVTGKDEARYQALKKLNQDFLEYSDKLKTSIARSELAYNELKKFKFPANQMEKEAAVLSLSKIIAKLNNESKNAQVYFDQVKDKFIAEQAVLNISILENASLPLQTLKKQNDNIATLAAEAVQEMKGKAEASEDAQINFPSSFEALIRESENQENLLFACQENKLKKCLTYFQVNEKMHAEVSARINKFDVDVQGMKNNELKERILAAKKNDELIEYGRLIDLASAAGEIK